MLPYDAQVLFAFFAQLNRSLWPLTLLAPLLGAAALALALWARPWSGRAVAALLALGWAWVGWGFFLERFALYNFLAPVYGWAFLVQALLLLVGGTLLGRLRFAGRAGLGPAGWAGLALALAALLLFPLLGPLYGGLYGEGWASAPLAGLMPGPTALLTLGLLLLAAPRRPLDLGLLPLLWAGVAGFEGWALGLPHGLALSALLVAGSGLLAWKRSGN